MAALALQASPSSRSSYLRACRTTVAEAERDFKTTLLDPLAAVDWGYPRCYTPTASRLERPIAGSMRRCRSESRTLRIKDILRVRWMTATFAVMLLAVMACGFASPAATPPPRPTPLGVLAPGTPLKELTIENFTHQDATVEVGTAVEWAQNDNAIHTVTHLPVGPAGKALFNSGRINKGERARHTFTEPGTYNYICQIHSTRMRATITVVPASG